MRRLRTVGILIKYLFLQEARSLQSLFWMLLFPVFMLVLFGFIFGQDGFRDSGVRVGIHPAVMEQTGLQPGSFSIEDTEEIELVVLDSQEGIQAVLDNSVYAYISRERDENRYAVYITERYKQFSFLLSSILDQVNLNAYRRLLRGREFFPYDLKVVTKNGRPFTYTYYLLSGIIGISLMLNCFFAIPQIIITYRNQGFLKRFIFSPLSKFDFTISLIIERSIIGFFQIVLLGAAAALIFDVKFLISPIAFFLTYVSGAAAFGIIGFFLSGVLNSIEASAAVAQILNMIFMFTAGIFFPLEIMPSFFTTVAKINPVYYLSHAVNASLLMGEDITAIGTDLLVLTGIFAVFFLATVFTFRYNRKL